MDSIDKHVHPFSLCTSKHSASDGGDDILLSKLSSQMSRRRRDLKRRNEVISHQNINGDFVSFSCLWDKLFTQENQQGFPHCICSFFSCAHGLICSLSAVFGSSLEDLLFLFVLVANRVTNVWVARGHPKRPVMENSG